MNFNQGLSPYTRGNHWLHRVNSDKSGSIPVHTGKPAHSLICVRIGKGSIPVHTGKPIIGHRCESSPRRGLSPYTRGNPPCLAYRAGRNGSIPVHTGKPFLTRGGTVLRWVYPRTHGETSVCAQCAKRA